MFVTAGTLTGLTNAAIHVLLRITLLLNSYQLQTRTGRQKQCVIVCATNIHYEVRRRMRWYWYWLLDGTIMIIRLMTFCLLQGQQCQSFPERNLVSPHLVNYRSSIGLTYLVSGISHVHVHQNLRVYIILL